MKYEIGQKVIIKKEIDYNAHAIEILEDSDYILTIASTHHDPKAEYTHYYGVEETGMIRWPEEYIEGLAEEPNCEPVNNRYELLDI